jgi:hypothetical protein
MEGNLLNTVMTLRSKEMKNVARFFALALFTLALSGCFLPGGGSTIPLSQNFTIYTTLPNQSVRVVCDMMRIQEVFPFVYQGLWFDIAFPVGSTEVTSSTPFNPGSSYPLYEATVPVHFGDSAVQSVFAVGCWSPLLPGGNFVLLKPQIWKNGAWEDWIALDPGGVGVTESVPYGLDLSL